MGRAARIDGGVELRLEDDWIEATGRTLQEGDGGEERLADLAQGRSFSVQFWEIGRAHV